MHRFLRFIKPVAFLAIFIVSGFNLVTYLQRYSSSSLQDQDITTSTLIYVAGAVQNPGLYNADKTTMVGELIAKAGGFAADADTVYINTSLNLAEAAQGQTKIVIPFKQDSEASAALQTSNPANRSAKLNINTASLAELTNLPGIGDSYATKIIAARPFSKIEDLLNVAGIGDKKFADLKDLIKV